jgi:hypothetical protein
MDTTDVLARLQRLKQHNHLRKLADMHRDGLLREGESINLRITHELRCVIRLGGFCDCDPQIVAKPLEECIELPTDEVDGVWVQ